MRLLESTPLAVPKVFVLISSAKNVLNHVTLPWLSLLLNQIRQYPTHHNFENCLILF